MNGRRKKTLLAGLEDLKRKLPQLGSAAEEALNYIESYFFRKAALVVEASDAIKLAAAERALHRKAPCHHDNKNSIADAMLIEIYTQVLRRGGPRDRFAFVTHNKNDFSSADHRKPHADIEALFTKIKSLYFINLSELLARAAWSEIRYEQSWQQEVRGMTEIIDAIDLLIKQVWHNRHMNREWAVAHGKLMVVPELEWQKAWQALEGEAKFKYAREHMSDAVWEAALKAARDTERDLGEGNHGPWSDFEWGMINGKLSALRWVLGEEWDMLDT